jgi:hypothetical protein
LEIAASQSPGKTAKQNNAARIEPTYLVHILETELFASAIPANPERPLCLP